MTFHRFSTTTPHIERCFEIEDRLLAPHAMRAADSLGRRHVEPEHPYRGPYVRDRDRIIHSAAFRRLAYKTQVFIGPSNDHHRTRLTHTLEVVQIARTAARNLRLNEDLTEASALAHDLGHPPFGHAGERVLAELLADHGGFEHNRQGLRLVEFLESRYPNFPGLNLTYEVLESMALHSKRPSAPEIFEFEPHRRMLAEGQAADLADSIAYSTHDIDDAIRHGLIQFEDLREVELGRIAEERARTNYGAALEGKQRTRAVIRSLIDLQVGGMIDESSRRLRNVESVDQVRAAQHNVVDLPEGMSKQKAELQAFLFARVYRHPSVTQSIREGEAKLRRLFETIARKPDLLPDKYRLRPDDAPLERRIADYIASMTDRFTNRLYSEMFGGSADR